MKSKRVSYEDMIQIGPYDWQGIKLREKQICDEWGEVFPGDEINLTPPKVVKDSEEMMKAESESIE